MNKMFVLKQNCFVVCLDLAFLLAKFQSYPQFYLVIDG